MTPGLTTDEALFTEQIAPILPAQGTWSDEDYLWLTHRTNRLVELSDGFIQVLQVPTERHQAIVEFLFLAFLAFTQQFGGKVRFAPLRLRLWSGKFREPDLLLLRSSADPRRHDAFWEGADLVLEVVSPDDPDRDLILKRSEYARAGISEYWIVDPQSEAITVLRLENGVYQEHGRFPRGDVANSALLEGFQVPVGSVFDAD